MFALRRAWMNALATGMKAPCTFDLQEYPAIAVLIRAFLLSIFLWKGPRQVGRHVFLLGNELRWDQYTEKQTRGRPRTKGILRNTQIKENDNERRYDCLLLFLAENERNRGKIELGMAGLLGWKPA